MAKNNAQICSRFQTITILLAKRTRLSHQSFFCRSQEKILVFRTGCDVKFSGRIGKKKSASLGPPWFCLRDNYFTCHPSPITEIDKHPDFGCHVTSLIQGLSPRRQGRKRREGLGTRLFIFGF